MTTAREIMNGNPRIVGTNETVTSIAELLESEGIGAVIVCNDEKRLQGVITDRDLAVGVLAKGKNPSTTIASELVDSTEVVTIGADDSVEEAIETMKNHAVRRLPVIDGLPESGRSCPDGRRGADQGSAGGNFPAQGTTPSAAERVARSA